MSETINISKMAEYLSDDIFSEFFWTKIGPTNENWPCEEPEHHKVITHPADVVFFYDEPYDLSRTYVHCDLKSYAKGSVTASAVRGAIESLAAQISCAEKSGSWQQYYDHGHVSY
jgi:hypothetical protein